jgi:nucleoid-associated protein YgaU
MSGLFGMESHIMMRTDAKIGFAIVGVLLTVLAVYAVVIPKHGKTAKQASGGQVQTVTIPPETAPPDTAVRVPPIAGDGESMPAAGPTKPPADIGGVVKPPVDVPPKHDDRTTVVTNPLTDLGDPTHLPGGATGPGGDARHSDVTPGRDPIARRTDRPGDDHGAANGRVATAAANHFYRVKAGQTLTSIAAEVYGDGQQWGQIAKANPGINPARLRVGTKLQLPDPATVRPRPSVVVPASEVVVEDPTVVATAGSSYRVKSGDSLYKIARQKLGSGRLADEVYELNRDAIGPNPTKLRLGMVLRLPTAADGGIGSGGGAFGGAFGGGVGVTDASN